MSEDDARELCRRVAAELGLHSFKSELSGDDGLRHGSTACGLERWARESTGESLDLARVGPLFFIDDSRYRGLSAPLQDQLGPNALRIRDLKDGYIAGPIGDFTTCTLAALLDAGVAGKHVVDLGAGDALLSLAAARLGAASLELVEVDAKALRAAKANLELNGLMERTDFRLVDADLADVEGAAKRLRPGAAPSAVICNIGYWEYGVTNAEGLLLTDLLPKAELFVGGGYSAAAVGGLAHLDADADLLKLMGFRARPERAELRRETTWRGDETAYSLVADRVEPRGLSHEELRSRLEQRRRSGASKWYALGRAALPWLILALIATLATLVYVLVKPFLR